MVEVSLEPDLGPFSFLEILTGGVDVSAWRRTIFGVAGGCIDVDKR